MHNSFIIKFSTTQSDYCISEPNSLFISDRKVLKRHAINKSSTMFMLYTVTVVFYFEFKTYTH